ncbi:TlpA family protein disulfide reductase [Nonomuraea sp. NPDC052265]|uniref:TlpA family protein disulfide reductase n=1 Tax=Nonomuraea sp. NPDC052265 TaxID=3364374 RepID=UPI0037C5C1A4
MTPLMMVSILVCVLCLVGLVLTLGVARRLQEHRKLIDALYEVVARGGAPGADGLTVGDTVGEFDVRTVDGGRVARDLLPDGTVVAFLSADCGRCRTELPELASWAARQDRSRVLVVVDAEPMAETLSPVAQVVVEAGEGRLTGAFQVTSFPSFFQVAADGSVRARIGGVSQLPAGSAA